MTLREVVSADAFFAYYVLDAIQPQKLLDDSYWFR